MFNEAYRRAYQMLFGKPAGPSPDAHLLSDYGSDRLTSPIGRGQPIAGAFYVPPQLPGQAESAAAPRYPTSYPLEPTAASLSHHYKLFTDDQKRQLRNQLVAYPQLQEAIGSQDEQQFSNALFRLNDADIRAIYAVFVSIQVPLPQP
jgi:hypothetical protein